MLWYKVAEQLTLHDITLIVGPNRTEKTKFLYEQYEGQPFTLDVSKAKIAYCGGDTRITDEEWTDISERDCPFIGVDDAHLLTPLDLVKLIDVAVETKKRLYMTCNETFVAQLPEFLSHAKLRRCSLVKLERFSDTDVCAWTLADVS
ncbi:hypothetical protein BCS58_18600 [Enterovibrio norvegicus]|uniref:hypothetical protein n=1 Tax=Enterovibrio norvegicus TaxID=188144 RepID=UPI00389ABB2E